MDLYILNCTLKRGFFVIFKENSCLAYKCTINNANNQYSSFVDDIDF